MLSAFPSHLLFPSHALFFTFFFPRPDFFSLLTHFSNHGGGDFVGLLIALIWKHWFECSATGEEFKIGAAAAKACGRTTTPWWLRVAIPSPRTLWATRKSHRHYSATKTTSVHLKQPWIMHGQDARSKTIGSIYKLAKYHNTSRRNTSSATV